MFPAEAERKLLALEEEHEATLKELAVYREFYDASLDLNMATAAAPQAKRVREAVNACETYKIRKDVDAGEKQSALEKLKALGGKHPRAKTS